AGELYQQAIDLHKKKLLEKKGAEFHIPVLKLQKAIPLRTIVYEIIREFGFTSHQTNDVIALLGSGSGRYVQSQTHRVIRNRAWLIITPNAGNESATILIEATGTVDFGNGKLSLKNLPVPASGSIPASPDMAFLDAGEITFPLLLRKWKQGDYFYPLGMTRKKKKLSRFLIDQKLSLVQKESVWVLEMNKKILWVVGMRIDDRFKINPSTQQVLQISYSRNE
ncbi:MAG TPA: tRNA lysidine(34) synthetase TilS, partial [Ferruginibacter sp.]|nr:tRNA lysidine(34) synthetase TilS [Ferruginibacter sp.]